MLVDPPKPSVLSPLLFDPGSKQEYSSYAYVLLSAVVQAAGQEEIGEIRTVLAGYSEN